MHETSIKKTLHISIDWGSYPLRPKLLAWQLLSSWQLYRVSPASSEELQPTQQTLRHSCSMQSGWFTCVKKKKITSRNLPTAPKCKTDNLTKYMYNLHYFDNNSTNNYGTKHFLTTTLMWTNILDSCSSIMMETWSINSWKSLPSDFTQRQGDKLCITNRCNYSHNMK